MTRGIHCDTIILDETTLEGIFMTPAPVFNLELATRVLAQMVNFPELHDQSKWVGFPGVNQHRPHETVCGTPRCSAGWVNELTGRKLRNVTGNMYSNIEQLVDGKWEKVRVQSVSEYAQKELGLTDDQADRLFIQTMDEEAAVDYLTKLIRRETKRRKHLARELEQVRIKAEHEATRERHQGIVRAREEAARSLAEMGM